MADKQSIREAISSIRKQRRLVKKSLGGIERQFYYDLEPKKALTTLEGTAIMNPEPVPIAVPLPDAVETQEAKDRRVRQGKPKKEKTVKEKVAEIEKKPTKFRVKRNTMPFFL
jgi:hypothetical protein